MIKIEEIIVDPPKVYPKETVFIQVKVREDDEWVLLFDTEELFFEGEVLLFINESEGNLNGKKFN